jgi:pimeloyl-ACP methyl ester carboxylesterase
MFDWITSASSKLRDTLFVQPSQPRMRAADSPPGRVFYEAARRAYDASPDPIHGWPLLLSTPTLKVFIHSNTRRLVVAVRGTDPRDRRDLNADFAIAANSLESTDRFKEDHDAFIRLTNAFPPAEWTYFMTGHSLGSAVGLALQRKYPFIVSGAIYYNGALQPGDIWTQTANAREMYVSKDPLYRTVGRLWRNKEVITPTTGPSTKDGFLPSFDEAVLAHGLDQFRRLYGSALQRATAIKTDANDTDLEAIIEHPLSDGDIRALLGHSTSIVTYPELRDAHKIEDVLDDKGRVVLLYLTTSKTAGHWTTVFTRDDDIEFFDPYGGAPDEQFDWIPDSIEAALGQTTRYLGRLLARASEDGYRVRHNPYQFQEMAKGVNSCGRWVAVRLIYSHLTIHQFKTLIDECGVSPDVFVAVVTDQLLHESKSQSLI